MVNNPNIVRMKRLARRTLRKIKGRTNKVVAKFEPLDLAPVMYNNFYYAFSHKSKTFKKNKRRGL